MTRRSLLKSLAVFPFLTASQLAPWLEKAPTPATDVLNEVFENIRELYPEGGVGVYVSNTFYRQLRVELGDEEPEAWGSFKLTGMPGWNNTITVELIVKHARSYSVHGTLPQATKSQYERKIFSYPLSDYTHIKGLDLLLERAPTTR